MGRGKVLSLEERSQIMSLREAGKSIHAISQILNRSRSVIRRYINNPLIYNTKKSFGRPLSLSQDIIETLAELRKNSLYTAKELRDKLGLSVSVGCVNRYLKKNKPHRSLLTTGRPIDMPYSISHGYQDKVNTSETAINNI